MTRPRLRNDQGIALPTTTPATPGQTLADWLHAAGFPLNTRCGGRGLCRGCTVLVNGEAQKACQLSVAGLQHAEIILPRTSRQDASMQGITAFELHPDVIKCSAQHPVNGIALDIGTTTLAGAVWSGNPPVCTASASLRNPQFRLGDNVVSRVHHALSSDQAAQQLQNILIQEGVLPLFEKLAETTEPEEIIISGNPVMLHLLAGESVNGFASYPFHPVFLDTRILDPALLELPANTRITLLPGLGPFVGADISAGALASGMLHCPGPSLLIDFGTNGEILLKTDHGYFATATAAGPAFEGGRLKCGSTGGKGVMGSLQMGKDAQSFLLPETGGPWHGIAGSAYVDAMALGRKADLLSPSGRFLQGTDAFQLAPEVEITEADIAELLQAKAAIQAGWTTLCEVAEVDPSEIKSVIVAGGFGYHLKPAHAAAIGLIPPVPESSVRLVGNSSLGGAGLCLIQPEAIHQILDLKSNTRIIELNQQPNFEDNYIDALML